MSDSSSSSAVAGPRPSLTRFAWLSVAAAVATIALKFAAYVLTGSVGLLSDAAESIVNLVAAVVALIALSVAARPADDNHPFGHAKAEYFSAAVEGVMIFVAAVVILVTSVQRFLDPQPLENVGLGLGISVLASALNGAVALVLLRAGRAHRSITLEADGKHLLTDVWTSVGVLVGVALVLLTGWWRLDALVAFAVGCNIVWAGSQLITRSVAGLMDAALDPPVVEELIARLQEIADEHRGEIEFHNLRTRQAGHNEFISLHLLVPGQWTVTEGHDLCERVEARLREGAEHRVISTHLEDCDDPRAYEEDLGIRVRARMGEA